MKWDDIFDYLVIGALCLCLVTITIVLSYSVIYLVTR